MTSLSPADILQAALQLPEADRLRVASEIRNSVAPSGVLIEGEPGFFEELDRRSAAMRSGEDPGVDAFEALNAIEKEIDDKKTS